MLGDCMIGTTPPLSLKILSDPHKPRAIDRSGKFKFTIGEFELYCGDNLIQDGLEQQVAWFLINYGSWPIQDLPCEVEEEQLISTGFFVAPEEQSNPNENFEIIGHLSQMISQQFNDMTIQEGEIRLLCPSNNPDTFGVFIPPDFRGTALPLWRFEIHPPLKE